MKTPTFCFTALFLIVFSLNANTQIYVNAAATGSNDGSSWANAYTTLHDALENYSANEEIWVAAGLYLPQQSSAWPGPAKNTFYIYQEVKLYGGFDGTETMLSERNPDVNVTILSGDLNGDDDETDVLVNRNDNVINVVFVEATITNATVIDGFNIVSGHADGDTSSPENQRGGGIWSLGSPQVENCRFALNYAMTWGGGLYVRGVNAAETVVANCFFENNLCVNSGGGMIVATLDAPETVEVSNCEFRFNDAQVGGGGLYSSTSQVNISNCQFSDNKSTIVGGAVFVSGYNTSDEQVSISDCSFSGNVSSNGGAYAYETNAGDNNATIFTNCEFIGNQSTDLNNDQFPDGGAISIELLGDISNDAHTFDNCVFQDNSAEGDGGAIIMLNWGGSGNHLQVNNSQFTGNSASGEGGGMAIWELGSTTVSTAVYNTHFSENAATTIQGFAAIYDLGFAPVISRNIKLVNCLFDGHNTNDLETYVVGSTNSALTLSSCTLSDNACASIGMESMGSMTLQNTILQNIGFPNAVAPVGAEVLSLGGNLISDTTLDAWLGPDDQSDLDPLFEAGTFQLSQNSPAVDAGVLPDDVPDVDLAGNDRVQGNTIDIGAYESPYVGSTNSTEALADSRSLSISPNPAGSMTSITLENDWQGELNLRIVNEQGQVIQVSNLEKSGPSAVLEIDTGNLPKGMYRVLVSNGRALTVSVFTKM